MITAKFRMFPPQLALLFLLALVFPVRLSADDRIYDLSFWPSQVASLKLGGLWQFYDQTWFDPLHPPETSEIWMEIDQTWPSATQDTAARSTLFATYVVAIRGLSPRSEGYRLSLDADNSHSSLLCLPRYAPQRFVIGTQAQLDGSPQLQLRFFPSASDEIWLLVVRRWRAEKSIPRLSRG